MEVKAAQSTKVARCPGLLSKQEIDQLHEAAQKAAPDCGSEVRRSDGTWKVVFLHTDGLLQTLLPELHAKLHQAGVLCLKLQVATMAQKIDLS